MYKKIIIAIAMITLTVAGASAAALESYQLLKIASKEQKAVMKTPEGGLQLIGIDDVIAGDAKVIEIAEGRVVLEQPGEDGSETVIFRLDGNSQRIERIQPRGEKPPVMTAPENVKNEGENRKPGY